MFFLLQSNLSKNKNIFYDLCLSDNNLKGTLVNRRCNFFFNLREIYLIVVFNLVYFVSHFIIVLHPGSTFIRRYFFLFSTVFSPLVSVPFFSTHTSYSLYRYIFSRRLNFKLLHLNNMP